MPFRSPTGSPCIHPKPQVFPSQPYCNRLHDLEATDNIEPLLIEAAGDRSFFLWAATDDPHRPYQADTIPEPHDPDKLDLAPWLADTPETRRDLAYYYDEIARFDRVVGDMMQTLEARNLVEDTLVMFLSDNGSPFPREKGTLYDAGVKAPLSSIGRARSPANAPRP